MAKEWWVENCRLDERKMKSVPCGRVEYSMIGSRSCIRYQMLHEQDQLDIALPYTRQTPTFVFSPNDCIHA